MHDPEFEKEVQKRMEELEFIPSEGVWMNLQRGRYKKERRRAPLFWLYFLLGGILVGAGGASLFYFHRSPSTISGAVTSEIAGTPPAGTVSNETRSTAAAPAVSETRSVAGSMGAPEATVAIGHFAKGRQRIISDPSRSVNAATASGHDRSFLDPFAAHRVAVTPIGLPLHEDIFGEAGYQPVRSPNTRIAGGLTTAFCVVMMNKQAAKKARFSARRSWEAGFAGGGGFSSTVIPGSSRVSDLPPGGMTLASSLQSSASRAARLQMRISRIQPDLSFWAGIFAERPIKKRLSLTAGLNLHYYSSRLETIADKRSLSTLNSLALGPTYFNASPYVQPVAPGSSYYAPDSYKFSNHYYFLQLPVSLIWQVNRSRKTPVFWEAGLALSRLISANALYYSEKSGLYYKDGGAANPNHLMAFSSVMVGLSLRGNSIKIGPEGQYGLTSLINKGNVGTQHLFYGGIKIIVIPRKW
jgi:hypothetical protein